MDWCAEHETVRFGGKCREIVHAVLPEATAGAFLAARTAADASSERFRANPENVAFNTLRRKFLCNFVKGGACAAMFVRGAVHKQYLHVLEPFVFKSF